MLICHFGYKQVVFLRANLSSLGIGLEQFCPFFRPMKRRSSALARGTQSVSTTGSGPNSLFGCSGGPVQLGRSLEIQGRFGPCSGVLQVREDDTGPAHEKGGMLADQQCNLFPQILSTLPETLVYYWIYAFRRS